MPEQPGSSAKREVKRRRRVTEEFRRQVVEETLAGENSIAALARALNYLHNSAPNREPVVFLYSEDTEFIGRQTPDRGAAGYRCVFLLSL